MKAFPLLKPAEVERLEQYIRDQGGQLRAGKALGVRPETLSRNLNGHTGPGRELRKRLVRLKIVAS